MKRFIISLLIFTFCFSLKLSAEASENFFTEQAIASGTDTLKEALPNGSRQYMEDKGFNPEKENWLSGLNLGEIFKDIWSILSNRARAPFATGGLIIAIVLVSSALKSAENSASSQTASFAITAVSAAAIITPLLQVINSAVSVMQSVAVFMTAFVPVFAVIVAAYGQGATSASMSGLLLGACQVVDIIANHFVIPIMCGYLSINIASGVSPLLQKTSISDTLKKLAYWIMTLLTTVFLGVLSIQTTISATGDSLTMRTARFIIGSSVPVAGTVLSEALTTVTASLGVLKASVAIYGVVACCAIFLPLLLELLVWRIALNITAGISEVLSVGNVVKLLKSADTVISLLCGIILLTGALFIISLTVVVSVGAKV